MIDDRIEIAVLGAGIGGLAVTAALRKFGLSAQIYEQATQFARIGAGIHMSPNATKVLMGLGISPAEVEQQAYFRLSSTHRDAYTGEMTADNPLGEAVKAKYGAPYTLWHRGDLHATLASLVPPELVHRSKKAVDVDAQRNKVRLSFADGTSITADALIAADGVHSVVREKLFNYTPPIFTGRVAYRTVLSLSEINEPHLDPTCKWWGSDRHFVHYRVGNKGEFAFTTSVPDDDWDVESWSAAGDPVKLRSEFADFHPDVRGILDAVKAVNIWGIHSRDPLDSWVAGRAVLMGDACHTMPPYMAQGAAMALEDAVVLARCIREAVDSGSHIQDAYDIYQAARLGRTAAVQRGARANNWGRFGWDADWVFGYDAFTVPLSSTKEEIA